jgi:hypothetical protein
LTDRSAGLKSNLLEFSIAEIFVEKAGSGIVSDVNIRAPGIEFGHEFLADFRRVRPFIVPEQCQAEEVVCVRRPRIQSDSLAEFADGVVLHFRFPIRVAEKYVKRSGIAHGGHDRVEKLRGFFLLSGSVRESRDMTR